MKSTWIAVVAAAGLAVGAGGASAQSGADLEKSKGCGTCHAADTKKVGPAWKDVAAKYKDNKGATDQLAAKLKEGKGHPKIGGSDAEIKTLVTYVLAGGK
jgi:cytochrome c